MTRRLIGAGLLAVCALADGRLEAARQAPPPAAELAARVQKRYEAIRDFTADFTQTYQGRLIRRTSTERGTIVLKKPNRVRFTYQAPERKTFVSDGSYFYSYFQEERLGSKNPLPKPDEAGTALLFLAGRGNLARDFTASIVADAPAGEWHLKLVPRSPQADFETLTLVLDPATLSLRGFITTEEQGTSTIRFTNLRENTGVADTAFNFSFPRGTEIIK
jgi:outer membrane lipoprotein carrier protein